MKFSAVLSCLVAVVAALLSSQSSAETVQTAANVFNGRPFLYVEGESASTINGTADGTTWKIATKGGPDMSFVICGNLGSHYASHVQCLRIPLSRLQENDFSTAHTATAQYQLKFITAGTYQFFLRQSLYDSNNNGTFLNEDSIYLPPAFNKNSGTDWIGFQSSNSMKMT